MKPDLNASGGKILYKYAHNILNDRWPEAEPRIMETPVHSYFYAKYVIKGRWEEAEEIIMQDPYLYRKYLRVLYKLDSCFNGEIEYLQYHIEVIVRRLNGLDESIKDFRRTMGGIMRSMPQE